VETNLCRQAASFLLLDYGRGEVGKSKYYCGFGLPRKTIQEGCVRRRRIAVKYFIKVYPKLDF